MVARIWQCLCKVLVVILGHVAKTTKKDTTTTTYKNNDNILTVSCRCGACVMHITDDPSLVTVASDCHCPSCRRYHTAAFGSFLRVRASSVVAVVRRDNNNDDDNDDDDDDNNNNDEDVWKSYRHECAQLGVVDRLFCKHCFAKLATKPIHQDDDSNNKRNNDSGSDDNDDDYDYYYINMGSLQDDTIRADYSAAWSHHRTAWQVQDPSQMAPWYPAHPDYVVTPPSRSSPSPSSLSSSSSSSSPPTPKDSDTTTTTKDIEMGKTSTATTSLATAPTEPAAASSSTSSSSSTAVAAAKKFSPSPTSPTPPTAALTTLQGGCVCGRVRYEITDWDIPNHMPHCYCHVCRHTSGAAFLSWIFCRKTHFGWIGDNQHHHHHHHHAATPVRTTDMAVRYFCKTCAGNVLMVYDEEADRRVWPTVGSVDDASWRKLASFLTTEQQQQQQQPPPRVGGCADGCLDYVSHIYCVARPLWYALPEDGLPRWDE
eukprot:scaffold34609_cov146-Amphora_coffeaeformis.AAC.1